ncbi:CoA pyrophosphatase [Rhodoferax sp.]|uniref:CoA pyrophosphatase n=1 Tax=Rhodoferax sp. TaxID=50421 RepID=UPI002ACE6B8F|nr:CoA pyrophosphatase [Rhodoferax sp.]MDZ7921640.1 CoA pyrophosphatase [Rhodoferax sp.]
MSNPPLFDPRAVPVIGRDAHLPAVLSEALQPAALRLRFAAPPLWSPELRAEPSFSSRAPAAASVLVPLVMRETLTVLLTHRTSHLSSHSGQVAFPGGKVDPDDADAVATALREAQEEIGLAPVHVEVLGTMPTYTTGSAFVVTPVVALVSEAMAVEANPHEVAQIFEVPLPFLMDPANHQRHRVQWEGQAREWLSMPYHDGQMEHFIWGATAGMLRNLYRFLQAH